jgi:Flp pilus assembly protein TadG
MFASLRRDEGQELVEYAIVFIILTTLILGIIEFGIVIFSQNTTSNVAREGARWAVVRRTFPAPNTYLPAIGGTIPPQTCSSASNAIIVYACQRALALDPARVQVTVTRPDRDNLRVRVQYTYNPFFGLIGQFLPSGLTLGSQSTMRLE